MDFMQVEEAHTAGRGKTDITVYPEFLYRETKDIVLKGGVMQAFWYNNHWEDRLDLLVKEVDNNVMKKFKELATTQPDKRVSSKLMLKNSSRMMEEFKKYCKNSPQSEVEFNTKILFSSDEMKREDYATWRLSYTPMEQEIPAFEEMYELLYAPRELEKIMWFIGATLTNSMTNIQKFLYLYGGKGTGKGTVIKLLELLFEEYKKDISVEELTSDNAFATNGVKQVPLLVDPDADLMKIRKDTNLLKLTAHEPLSINNKYQQQYNLTFKGLLVVASNQRYVVRNVDAGITRRAVVAEPSDVVHSPEKYRELMHKLKYEISGVAHACIRTFNKLGINYYEEYTNVEMAEATDHIFHFVRENAEIMGDTCTLSKASKLYKLYLEDIGFDTNGYKRKIKNELQRYFYEFKGQLRMDDGTVQRNVFVGFKTKVAFPERYTVQENDNAGLPTMDPLTAFGLTNTESLLDAQYKDEPAQLASKSGSPTHKWDEVKTTLSEIDTTELHWVQLPKEHIIIDLDLKNESGEKDILLNIEEARKFPETYTEISKSGNGLHLHYIWDGDVDQLENEVKEDVEIKKFVGRSSLRRKLSYCNHADVKHISTGLPFKEDTKMRKEVETIMWDEKKLRTLIEKNLRKEYHSATKPSIDFISNVLHRAKEQGLKYDLSDMRNDVLVFGMSSTNQSSYCRSIIIDMPFSTIEKEELTLEINDESMQVPDEDIVFYDVEVFSNLFVVAFKKKGEKGTVWINPTSTQIEQLCENPLVGFNNRRYDNHILYGAMLGLDNMGLYRLSQGIISNNKEMSYSGAYELSYADIFEYNSTKQSLKKWEVELNINHDEIEIPWDKPVDESMFERVGEYCLNDVEATEALFDHTYYDYTARLILSAISGMTVNSSTQNQAARILFGTDPKPQDKFEYTDLSKEFPGYQFSYGKSTYKGEDPSEGGYVYSEPGIHENVGLYDVRSMHPYSAIALNCFGPYTKTFQDLVETRVAIKEGRLDDARNMYDGKLKPFLEDESQASDLAYALKIIINIVYGMTSASFPNKFKDPRNYDNIVAKRGALFMIDLKLAVQALGYQVVHVKTDSIKVANADDKVKDFIFEFGEKYKYVFEHEATYSKIALVNKAVYIAEYGWAEKEDKIGTWEAVGKQFAEPFVYKNLFTGEDLEWKDYAIVKQTTKPIYIDDLFIGKIAEVYASKTGGEMLRVDEEADKVGAVTGTKGYKWKLFSEFTDKSDIDMTYYEELLKSAIGNIEKVGDITKFIDIPEKYKS